VQAIISDTGAALNHLVWQFSYLQLLDFLTTVAFLANGIREGNPIVRFMMDSTPSPILGLLAVKVAALALGLFCWRLGRVRLLTRMNLMFAIIVAWNIVAIIVGAAGIS
jgi:hypothetical protein